MSFLTAEWRNLAMANFEVNPHVFEGLIPKGTFLDLWEGKCYISLVGFMFLNTKVLGFKIPFHTNFEEVNLRFYVKYFKNQQMKRGVVFIKEIVPKKALSFIANTVYHENYETRPMKHSWRVLDDKKIINYSWKNKGKWQSFTVESKLEGIELKPESEEEFITEHYWGYTRVNEHKTFEYEVIHPKWKIYDIINYNISVDFGLIYGDRFRDLNHATPKSVILAEGSEIEIESKKEL